MRVWGTFWRDPEEADRSIDLDLIRRGWTFVRPYRRTQLVYLAATGAGSLLQVAPALLIRQIVDLALPHRDAWALGLLTAGLVLVFVSSSLLLVGQRWLSLGSAPGSSSRSGWRSTASSSACRWPSSRGPGRA